MGFLDHSTNNIIVDAVLTDAGRRALSRNDGSFQVFQFALGDDEVDYEIIEQYGRTVGKEKIEKNTPVLEALTAGSLGLKYKLVGIDNEFVTHFPNMTIQAGTSNTEVTGASATVPVYNIGNNSGESKKKTIRVQVQPSAGTPSVDVQLIDSSYRVEINSIFFEIDGNPPDIIYTDNIAVHEINASPGDNLVASTASFSLTVKQMSNTTFNIFSVSGGNFIKSFVKVTGINSGLTKTFELKIENSNS